MLSTLLKAKTSPSVAVMIVLIDIVLSAIVIWKVAYTEIDWKAYMEEVEGFLNGERNYLNIRGNTGPLVYPAGFLYVFTALRRATEAGTNIATAQWIFGGFYIVNLIVVLALFCLDSGVPAIANALLLCSKRVHSIYMLRMFNDCLAVLCGYIAVLLFTQQRWYAGSAVYSFGVSIKMNMLLYAPGVLLVLLLGTSGMTETVVCLSICAGVQLLLGYPFLSTYPIEYLTKAFELSRVFMYKWTVNYKFLPEEIFTSKPLSIALLVMTALGMLLFAHKWIREIQSQCQLRTSESNKDSHIDLPNNGRSSQNSTNSNASSHNSHSNGSSINNHSSSSSKRVEMVNESSNKIIGMGNLSARFVITTIMTSNFIGIVFARTLHYQFYCWYFHSLPYLLWHAQPLPLVLKLMIMAAIELSFNVYPATWWSSALLQICHAILLVALYCTPVPKVSTNWTKGNTDASTAEMAQAVALDVDNMAKDSRVVKASSHAHVSKQKSI